MKKLLGLVAVAMLFAGCDDGDLAVENINFDDVQLRRCATNPNILYKIADSEAFILDLPQPSAFVNEATPEATPRIFTIDANNRVVYRLYNGTLATENICEIIQPVTPIVIEEWIATSGTVAITTTPSREPNANLEGGEKITGYKHTVSFPSITFQKPNGTNQVYAPLELGSFVDNTGIIPLPFAFGDELLKCNASNTVFKFINGEGFSLDIDPALITNEVTPIGAPRVGYTGSDTNKLTYKLANGILTSDYFCLNPTPALPSILQEWIAVNGIENISGVIEVTTTTNGPGSFLHEIHLKNVILQRGTSTFKLANDYLFGYLITS